MKLTYFFLFLVSLLALGCKREDPQPPVAAQVEYRLEAAGAQVASRVIYKNDSGGNTTLENVPLPFSVTVKVTSRPSTLSVSGTVTGENGQPAVLTGTIRVDGKEMSRDSSTGTAASVTSTYVLL